MISYKRRKGESNVQVRKLEIFGRAKDGEQTNEKPNYIEKVVE